MSGADPARAPLDCASCRAFTLDVAFRSCDDLWGQCEFGVFSGTSQASAGIGCKQHYPAWRTPARIAFAFVENLQEPLRRAIETAMQAPDGVAPDPNVIARLVLTIIVRGLIGEARR